MNYQEKYQKARQAGYSDKEIMEFLSQKDPSFGEKMQKAEDVGYSPEEVLTFFNAPAKKKEIGFGDYAKDFGKQAAQGVGIGSIGTYGDILDIFGLQSQQQLPGERAQFELEAKATPEQLPFLVDTDDVLPRYSRLPSSQQTEEFGTELGLISKPETPAGRYGRRIGKLGGAGLALGSTAIASPIAAGLAGQTLEEFGAPEWAQAAAEIIASVKASPKTTMPVTSKTPEVEKTIKALRKAGYSEKDITLAKNALEERKILKKYASLTPEAENAIQKGVKNSEDLFKEQITKGLPGYTEGGLPYLEKQASNVYQAMEEVASSVPVKNTEPVRKSIEDAIAYLEKYPLLKEQKEFIEFMKDGLKKLQGTKDVGKLAKSGEGALKADFLTGFYRNLGKAGSWGDPKQKEHLLGMVRQGIKDTFAKSGPESAKFGKYFEKTNEAWKQWLNARDLMQTIEKAQSVDGTNFKKLASILNDKSNHELAKKVLGPEQVKNIKSISEGAQAIESLLKQIPKTDKSIQSLKFLEGIRSLFTGDYRPLAALFGLEGSKRYATSLLFDPKKQNQMKRLITAAKNNSPQQAAIIIQDIFKNFHLSKEEEQRQLKSVK